MTDSLKNANADFAALEAALLDAFTVAMKGINAKEQTLLEESQGGDSQDHLLQNLLRTWYWQDPRAYAYSYVAATYSDLEKANALL